MGESTMASHVKLSDTPRDAGIALHARGLALTESNRGILRQILTTTLGRFAHRIRDIHVWLDDVNGPRGGMHIRCRIDVQFRPRGRNWVSALAIDEYSAVAKAAVRALELVDRRIKKARTRRRQLVRQ